MRISKFKFADLHAKSLGLGLMLAGCGGSAAVPVDGGSANSPSQITRYAGTFEGIRALEKAANGAQIVRWNAVPAENVVYSIFKGTKDAAIEYESPISTAQGDHYIYRPKTRFTNGEMCFAVRISNVEGDLNKKVLCATDDPLVFPGAESLGRLADGSYLLTWPKLAVEDIVYSIYERKNSDQFNFDQPSYDGIQNNFFGQMSPVERGTRYCYVVRYVHPQLPQDTNIKELCTESEEPIVFEGVSDLQSVGNGAIKVTWVLADSRIVKGYRIYQGSDFREIVKTVPASAREAVIEGLVSGRQYNIGIRAVDEFQREDRNIRIRAIIVP